jgi:hypothetical protein
MTNSAFSWDNILNAVASTTVIVAAIGFVAKSAFQQLLSRDLESHKKRIAIAAAKTDRIQQEVIRWANPIVGAVDELHRRLLNILTKQGYIALAPEPNPPIGSSWSITYDYFLPSTVFLFCRYLCWVRLLEENMSFELFSRHDDKDAFLGKIRAVGHTLSGYPLAELYDLEGEEDRQIFSLQQQALGEALIVRDGCKLRCMRYSEFLQEWPEEAFKHEFDVLVAFIDGLQPTDYHRWRRLELMDKALQELDDECRRLLQLPVT